MTDTICTLAILEQIHDAWSRFSRNHTFPVKGQIPENKDFHFIGDGFVIGNDQIHIKLLVEKNAAWITINCVKFYNIGGRPNLHAFKYMCEKTQINETQVLVELHSILTAMRFWLTKMPIPAHKGDEQ